jgi:5,10-methylenetetrahydromethanopterin reductase
MEEVTFTVREILTGERMSYEGTQIQLEDIKLVHPPEQIPPISLGVRGPKSLALSGRVAGGTILAEYAAPAYVSWARQQIKEGQREAGLDFEQRITVFALTAAGETTAEARQEVRPRVATAVYSGKIDAQLEPLNILPQVRELRNSQDLDHFTAVMPDTWIDQLAIVGNKEEWQAAIDHYVEAGVNSVVLVPLPGKSVREMEVFARILFK